MIKCLINPNLIRNIYHIPKEHLRLQYINKSIHIYFGYNILNKILKKIVGKKSTKYIFTNSYHYKNKSFIGNIHKPKYIVAIGNTKILDKGKELHNKNKKSKLILVPTSCSNDSFFTNRYCETNANHHVCAALKGKLPDYLIVDYKIITEFSNKKSVFAGWGEFIALITSYHDWRVNNIKRIKKRDLQVLDKLIEEMYKDINRVLKTKIDKKDLPLLMKYLFLKCLFMLCYDDNTIGASSDHMISYGLEKLKYCKNILHGQKVLFGSIIAAAGYKIIYNKDIISISPKKIIKKTLDLSEIKSLLKPTVLKRIVNAAIYSRNRKTILNKFVKDNQIYSKILKEVKNVHTTYS